VIFVLVVVGAFALPTFPKEFTAKTTRTRVEAGKIISKTDLKVYYDVHNNCCRIDTALEVEGETSTEIFRGDFGIEIFTTGVDHCMVVEAPRTLPYHFDVPSDLAYFGFDVSQVRPMDVVIFKSESAKASYYIHRKTQNPVRVVIGDTNCYEQIDFLHIEMSVDRKMFDIPTKCEDAILPGTNKLMTRDDFVKYFTTIQVADFETPSVPIRVEMKQLNLSSSLNKRVDPDKVIAIGTQLWQIVKDNAPTTAVNTLSNGAVPEGSQWLDFAGFNAKSWGPFGWVYYNGFGAQVMTYLWSFDWSCAGNWKGIGLYIQNAGPFPQKIDVGWGHNVAVDAQILQPTNAGTREDPIATLIVYMTMKMSTALSVQTQACKVVVRGDCGGTILFCDKY